ncbi:hypothetical protein FLA_1166 [Filimonas lacunae]|nr:hypothetical protein FLA_1166 [Filimonas lacunae]
MLVCTAALSQDYKKYKDDSLKLSRIKVMDGKLKTTRQSEYSSLLPIKSMHAYDVRLDTSYVCFAFKARPFHWNGADVKSNKLKPAHGLAMEYTTFLSEYFHPQISDSAEGSFHCFIKKCMISEIDTLWEGKMGKKHALMRLKVELECYYKQAEDYCPALRIDSSYLIELEEIEVEKAMSYALEEMTELISLKLNSADFNRIIQRKKYTFSQLQERYANPANVHRLLSFTGFTKGIYTSFEEWKNNAPALPGNFTVREEKDNVKTLWDSHQNQVFSKDVFGFSDGSRFWIQSAGFYFPLIRIQNGFEFYGISKSLLRFTTKPYNSDGAPLGFQPMLVELFAGHKNPKYTLDALHRVDIETGEIY